MILLLGDIHGNASILSQALGIAKESNAVAIVQLGDFGLFLDNETWFRQNIINAHIPVYFIDGNHDDCKRWVGYNKVTRVWDDCELFYVPRGTVMELLGPDMEDLLEMMNRYFFFFTLYSLILVFNLIFYEQRYGIFSFSQLFFNFLYTSLPFS